MGGELTPKEQEKREPVRLDAAGPPLVFGPGAWASFTETLKSGGFTTSGVRTAARWGTGQGRGPHRCVRFSSVPQVPSE